MLTGITSSKEIIRSQQILKKRLKETESEQIPVRYSSPAGVGNEVMAGYSETYGIWWYFDGKEDTWWNPYGLGRPADGRPVTGRCQINMSKKGLNRQVAGAFATDEEGRLFLLHSGKVGGGKKGVGKSAFTDWYPDKPVTVDFDGEKADYFIIAEPGSSGFFEQLVFFVKKVYEFKETADHTGIAGLTNQERLLSNGESLFRTPYNLPERTVLRSADHARITNSLLETLKEAGFKAFRNRFIDTFIMDDSGEITYIFEIKSRLTTQTLYTAVGQLFIYGLKHRAVYVVVLEETVPADLVEDLGKLKINCLTYRWLNEKPVFDGVLKLHSFI